MSTDIEAIERNPLSVSEQDLQAMMAELGGEEPDTDPQAADDGEPAGDDAGEAGEPQGQQADPGEGEPSNATVLTRDGKHQIPYSVLETERNRAREAQQAAQAAQQLADQERGAREALERQLAELQQAASTAAQGTPQGEQRSADEIISPEQLEAIRDEAPDLAAVFDRLIERVNTLQGEVQTSRQTAEQERAERQAEQQRRMQERVEEAIGNNPKLVYTRAEKPEVFNAIVEIDDWVRQNPQFKGLTLEQRFEKSVAMYEAANSPIEVPGNASQAGRGVSAAAAAAIAKASGTPAPNTLSDLPGGGLPARSDADAVASLSAADLQQRFMDMDPGQIETLLAKLPL